MSDIEWTSNDGHEQHGGNRWWWPRPPTMRWTTYTQDGRVRVGELCADEGRKRTGERWRMGKKWGSFVATCGRSSRSRRVKWGVPLPQMWLLLGFWAVGWAPSPRPLDVEGYIGLTHMRSWHLPGGRWPLPGGGRQLVGRPAGPDRV